MDKIRIYTVAQELGVPSQELLAFFEENGQTFSSHLAVIDAASADRARAHFAIPRTDRVETVLSPAAAVARQGDTAVLDFAPFQVETPAKAEPEWQEDEHLYVSSQEAVAKVEEKVRAAAQAPVRQSLLTSTIATASVAVAPTFVAFATFVFGNPNPRPLLATLLSIILTAGAIIAGSAVWATQPESAGFSFGDLMLWSWVRREAAERALIENTAVLGFDRFGRFLGNSTAPQEEQMRAVREIAAALDAKSSYTLGHSRRVEKHVRKVAEAMGLSAEQVADLATAAALHDIGNIQIPDEVLRKTGELTIEERDAIEAHVLLGARMVLKAGNENVVDGIRHHHERWDGAGYPDGMSGSEIPLFARLIGIAEAYDAMTSTRPYRQGFGRDHAVEVLRAESGRQFDGELVELFVSTLPEPLAMVKKFPLLARVQQQVHELQLLFKRMGAVAISATASTIAIALILGGTVLSPGTQDAPEVADKHRKVTPIDRVLGSRLHNEAAYVSGAPFSTALSPRESALELTRLAGDDSELAANLDGDDLGVPGGNGSGNGGNGGNGEGPGSGGPGNGNAGPGKGNGPGGGGSAGSGPVTGSGPVSGGVTTDRGSGGGSTATPPPPAYDGPGKSENAPGRNKGGARGNSANAPGHNKGGARGNSSSAPGHNKGSGAPGNSGNAPGQSGATPGSSGSSNAGGNAGGNSSNAPGHTGATAGSSGSSNAGGNAGGNSSGGGSSNAGSNSSSGGSSNAGGNSGSSNAGGSSAGVGAGAGATASPGNSGSAPGQAATPGSSGTSNAGKK